MREQLVDQLKTQVTDLERYIQYLQQKQDGLKCVKNVNGDCTCDCPIHGHSPTGIEAYNDFTAQNRKRKQASGAGVKYGSGTEADDAAKVMKRVVTLLQMITFAQFGCSSSQMNRFGTKQTGNKGTHWAEFKARLDMAVAKILEIDGEKLCNDSDYTSDSEDNVFVAGNSEKMTTAIRKDLAPAIKDLLEHGIVQIQSANRSLIVGHLLDWTCFSARNSSSSSPKRMTAWDLLVRYYHSKVG